MKFINIIFCISLISINYNCAHKNIEPQVVISKDLIKNPPEIEDERNLTQQIEKLSDTDISYKKQNLPSPKEEKDILDLLKEELNKQQENESLLEDIYYIIEAQKLERNLDLINAQTKWFNALKLSDNKLANFCLKNWIRLLIINQPSNLYLDDLIRIILTQTQNAQCCPYLKKLKLYKENVLKNFLISTILDFEDTVKNKINLTTEDLNILPPKEQVPQDDPELLKTVNKYCNLTTEQRLLWKNWIKLLKWPLTVYWQALVEEVCNNNYNYALSLFISTKNYSFKNKKNVEFAYYSALAIIRIYKILGKRKQMAQAYAALKKIWTTARLKPQHFNYKDQSYYYIRKINDYILICSYQALVQQYSEAKKTCHEGLNIVREYLRYNSKKVSLTNYQKFLSLKAELYYTLAFKIALYEKQYEIAIAFASAGLQIPQLSNDWKERFKWILGFANYLYQNYEDATYYLEELANNTKNLNLKSQYIFWLMQTYLKLQNPSKAQEYYNKLIEEFPLSFYSVIAIDLAQIKFEKSWWSTFLEDNKMNIALNDKSKFDLSPLKNYNLILKELTRSEILINSKLNDLAYYTTFNLEQLIKKNFLITQNESIFVYLTRLEYASGLHFNSINLITQLSEQNSKFWETWPEQIWIYFPRPYSEIINSISNEQQIPSSWLFAIARQESTFRSKVKSPAGALGIMQIMPFLANTITHKHNLNLQEKDTIDKLLFDPIVNINIASFYLKELKNKYKDNLAQIFGAYNAGEEAMDIWMTTIPTSNVVEWIEFISFGETREYIKKVWRNVAIYEFLQKQLQQNSTYSFINH